MGVERALRESQHRLELTIDGAGLGLWDWYVKEDVLIVNELGARMLGYEEERYSPRIFGWERLIHPDDLDRVGEELEAHFADETPLYSVELRMRHRDGSWVWILARGRVMERDPDGNPARMTGTYLDISGRKASEHALLESKNRLQLLYELTSRRSDDLRPQIEEALKLSTRLLGMDVGILSRIDARTYNVEFCFAPGTELRDGTAFQLGNTYCSIALTANDLLAISQTRLTPHQRHPCYGVIKLESYVGLPIYVFDELYGTLNFTAREPRSTPFSMQDKDFVRMLGAWISSALENRKVMAELTASEKKYRSSFDHAAIGKAHVSRDGRWLQVNEALCGLIGYSEEELLGKPFRDITHPEDLPLDLSYVDAMLERRISSYSIEKRYFKKDGGMVWVLLTVSAASDEHDEVSYFVAEVQDISAQKELEQQLIQQAQHDSLTGLANRSVFMARLSEELAWCRNDPSKLLAVLFMDFDRFKMVNDSLGHTSGDRLLVIVAERIRKSLGDAYLFARLGGDEFGVLLPGITDRRQAAEVAEQIQDALRDPVEIKDHEVFPSASIGIVITDGGYEQPEDVLRDADTAMYRAKEGEGAGYRIFSKEMHILAAERLRMDSELRRAIDNEEFIPHYQPIVDLSDGSLIGFEALARWAHPTKGLVRPATFISHAEEIGLVKQIDRQVMERACRDLRAWRNELGPRSDLVIHVNCSAHHLLDATLADHIAALLDESDLEPSTLMIELTESVFIEDLERAAREIHRLKSFGVHMCVDDFGTGYSSLLSLHTLPIDALKIDRGFLANMFGEGRRKRIVHTVLDIAHRLGMTVIAEGIEHVRQLDALRKLDCPFGQGYLFSKPLVASDARSLLRSSPRWRRFWR